MPTLTDLQIAGLVKLAKFSSGGQRRSPKAAHDEFNADLVSACGTKFRLIARLNRANPADFTIGVMYFASDGQQLFLKRYNGASHPHRNHLEKVGFGREFHIHTLTARYLDSAHKPEGYAEVTTAYTTAEEAFDLCIWECAVEGIAREDVFGAPERQLSLLGL